MQRPAADVRQRQHLEHAAVEDLLDDIGGDQGTEGVEHRLRPRVHLLGLAAGQVAEVLTTHRVERPEDHDLAMLPAFHHGLKPRAQGQRRLPGAGTSSERDDPDVRVEQQVQGDALFRAAPVQAESVAVAADEPDLLLRGHPAQGAAPVGDEHQPGVARQLPRLGEVHPLGLVHRVDQLTRDGELGHAGPARLDRPRAAVLLRRQPDRGGLHPHREVLAHQRHVRTVRRQVAGHGQDAGVVVTEPEPWRQHRRVGVVELDPHGAGGPVGLPDRQRLVEPTVLDAQVVEQSQRLPGEVPELRVRALGLQLDDHDHRQHDLVLLEPQDRQRIGEEHAGVEHEGPPSRVPAVTSSGSSHDSDLPCG
ncbi:MAG: hypothetical protein QOK15_2536 [Nocardioidaceae bacterium]|nr:hypothetical protein [Nocardioidaceae bacterium]